MKRIASAFAVAFVALALFAAPALADEKHGGKDADKGQGMGMMDSQHGKGAWRDDGKVRMEHHKLMKETLEMMKQTMSILKDVKHEPSADQKKRLDEMIGKIDEIIKRHDEMMMKKQEMMKDKNDSNGK